ncbi:MAG: hydroxyacid dehydrogenase [Clostridia bacterium]|nr:hydroxyacid dehydrogenase [Clostridia bacterium]
MKAILLIDENHRNYHADEFFHVYSDEVLDRIQHLVDLEAVPVCLSQLPEKQAMLKDVEVIFSNWGMPEMRLQDVQKYLPRVRAVFYAGGDVRHFASPYFQMGARVFAAGSANALPAAEYAVGQILLAAKGVQRACRRYRDGESYQQCRAETARRAGNYHLTVGILGVGRVGGRVAELLKNFDVTVYACDPFLSPEKARQANVKLTSMEEIFQSCDVITCHLPVLDNLHHVINEDLLSTLSPYATFINASQSWVVDQDALARVMERCPDLTAILDSTDPYMLPGDHPLHHLDNVFLTPHIAGSFGGELERMGESIVDALEAWLQGRPSPNEVSRDMMKE